MIEDLPDYPSLKKLADALWRQNVKRHGAAIMIGAGFSRGSSKHVDGTKKLPLWRDLAEKLASELDGGDERRPASDPLRLAEEYRAFFGQAALNDLIRSEINDAAWQPGDLHSDLLSLPWSEVMTTNWDTLLERAADSIHAPIYGLVAKQSDLAYVRSPRIVKLHGSIGTTDQFVVAQEDYRKYPQTNAAFVNFARQVFIENELCLLGFSGDDPNFLQWAGWVRDHLADHARRIYLVGALNLSVANRKFLESINIAPIDLGKVVQGFDADLKHTQAIKRFLQALLDEKPKPSHKWDSETGIVRQTTSDDFSRWHKDHALAASLLEAQLDGLRQNRETYPGWLVCPPWLKQRISSRAHAPYPNAESMSCLKPSSRATLLYEIAWGQAIALEPVPSWLTTELACIADPVTPSAISKRHQLEICLLLLREARRHRNRTEFVKWSGVIETYVEHLPDSAAEVAYQQALMAHDSLDYPRIEMVIGKIAGEDPIWKLRQASLRAILGQFEEGGALVADAYKELRERSRRDPSSIRIQSRLAWARWMYRTVHLSRHWELLEQESNVFKDLKTDPWDHVAYFREQASRQLEDFYKTREQIEPLFAQGHYRDHSSGRRMVAANGLLSDLEGLIETVGLPLRWDNIALFTDVAERLLIAEGQGLDQSGYIMAIRSAHSEDAPAIEHIFSRLALASAPHETCAVLSGQVRSAIEYWQRQSSSGIVERKHYAINTLRVLIEVLARLSIRLSPQQAKESFLLAMALGRDSNLQVRFLFEPIRHLAKYALDSIPESQHEELLFDALSFPLPCEIGIREKYESDRWPNPVIDVPCRRTSDKRLDERIQELISLAVPGTPSCALSLIRLLPLIENKTLTKEELDRLATRLWDETPDYKSLPDTGLLANWVLALPTTSRHDANELLSRVLFEANDSVLFTAEHLSAISGSATSKPVPLFPSAKQAVDLFDRLVSWRPPVGKDDPFGTRTRERQSIIEGIGAALSYSIVPSLSLEYLTVERFDKLWATYFEAGVYSAIVALPYFSALHCEIATKTEKAIRKGLQGITSSEVRYAAQALYQWKSLVAGDPKLPPPADSLIAKMVYLVESGRAIGLHSLLWYARSMLNHKWLSLEELNTLAECVPDLFETTEYSRINPRSEEAVTASLIREHCVRLAVALMTVAPSGRLQTVIDAAIYDALPEVRFAGCPPDS